MSEYILRVEGRGNAYVHRSPHVNRNPVGKDRGREYLTKNLAEARRFPSLNSAEMHARRLKKPYKGNGLENATFEIVPIEFVVGGVQLRV
jgi:hypothetical protein